MKVLFLKDVARVAHAGDITDVKDGYGRNYLLPQGLAVIATNATLDKAQAQRIAMMAHDGMARAVRPLHTPFDGDTVFALSTTRMALPEPAAMSIARIGAIAADCLARAIGRAVFSAESLGDAPGYRQSYSDAFADGAKTG